MADPIDDIEDFNHSGPQYRLRGAAVEKAVAAERERCAKIAENIYGGTAHTYASENADVYRAQDDTCRKIATAIRKE